MFIHVDGFVSSGRVTFRANPFDLITAQLVKVGEQSACDAKLFVTGFPAATFGAFIFFVHLVSTPPKIRTTSYR